MKLKALEPLKGTKENTGNLTRDKSFNKNKICFSSASPNQLIALINEK